MKLLFDQNISHRILSILPSAFANSSHVKQESLINSTDKFIWEFAKINAFTIVTQDSDFNDLNSLYGFPPKIIWIRTGNMKTEVFVNILIEYQEELKTFLDDENYGCFEILNIIKK